MCCMTQVVENRKYFSSWVVLGVGFLGCLEKGGWGEETCAVNLRTPHGGPDR